MANIFDKLHVTLTAASRAKTVKQSAKERSNKENHVPSVVAFECPARSQSKINTNTKKKPAVVLETLNRPPVPVSQPDSKCKFMPIPLIISS